MEIGTQAGRSNSGFASRAICQQSLIIQCR